MPTHTQNTSDGETRGCAHTTRSPSRGHETRATQVHITINIARQPVVMRGFCSLSTPRTSHCVHAAHPIHRAFASRRLVRTRAITRTSVFAPQQVRAHRTQQTRTHTNTHIHRTHALAHVSLPNHAASKSTGDGALWQRHQSASIGINRHTSLCAHTSVTRQSDGCWVAWAWWQFRPRGRRHASTGGRELSHARCLHPTRAHHACIHPSISGAITHPQSHRVPFPPLPRSPRRDQVARDNGEARDDEEGCALHEGGAHADPSTGDVPRSPLHARAHRACRPVGGGGDERAAYVQARAACWRDK